MNKKLLLVVGVVMVFSLGGCKKDVPPPVVRPAVKPPAPIAQPIVPTTVEVLGASLPLEEALRIAETECVQEGESLGEPNYNPNSKTWWFDAGLSEVKPGCNPACVVWEDGRSEINWRCTGALPDETSGELNSDSSGS